MSNEDEIRVLRKNLWEARAAFDRARTKVTKEAAVQALSVASESLRVALDGGEPKETPAPPPVRHRASLVRKALTKEIHSAVVATPKELAPDIAASLSPKALALLSRIFHGSPPARRSFELRELFNAQLICGIDRLENVKVTELGAEVIRNLEVPQDRKASREQS